MRKILLIIVCIVISNYSFGQDSTFTYQKDGFDIYERYRFHPNGNPKEIYYFTHGERPLSAYTKEDLFQRAIQYNSNDSTLIASIQDSIAFCRDNGRVDYKTYFINEGDAASYFYAHYVYDKNASLMRIDTQYLYVPREISFSNNTLTLKSRPDKNIQKNVELPPTKIGRRIKVPLIINSELDEAIKIIVNPSSNYFSNNIDISDIYFELEPNQDGKIFLYFPVSRTYQIYGLNIKVQSYKETYNIDLHYKFKAFHFSEDDLKEAVGIKHSDNRELAFSFNNNHKRNIKISKDKKVVLDEISTKDYTILYISKLEKGDYYLEIIDEVTKEEKSFILMLK